MNKRIRELAEQARGTKKHVPPVWQFYDSELEKFAELMIKEHIDLLRNEWYELNNLPEVEGESPRDIGLRVGRKTEVNVLIEKIRKHWNIDI